MTSYPKLISWSYRNGQGLFSSKKDKDFVNLYFVRNAEVEETIKKAGYIPSDAWGPDFLVFMFRKNGDLLHVLAHMEKLKTNSKNNIRIWRINILVNTQMLERI